MPIEETERKAALDGLLREMMQMPGQSGFYYQDLESGRTVTYHADTPFLSASIVKLPLMAALLLARSRGEVRFDEVLTIRDDQKVPGCGALQHMTGDVRLDIESLGKLMITISDNTATNALFRRLGAERVRALFEELGLRHTAMTRCFWDAEKEAAGLHNVFAPGEMGELLADIYHHRLVDEEASIWLERTLLQQQINHKMGGALPMDFPIAHKTGDEGDKAHDVGIVYAAHPFVACFAYVGPRMRAFEDVIRRGTAALAEVHSDPAA